MIRFAQIDTAASQLHRIISIREYAVAPDPLPADLVEIDNTITEEHSYDPASESFSLVSTAPAVANVADARIVQLRAMCRAHIVGSATSDALGTTHTYPTSETDQLNLNGLVTSSLLNSADQAWNRLMWCADATGVWDRRSHSHEQVRAVGTAVEAHVVAAQNQLKALNDQIQAIVADASLSDEEKRTAITAVTW